MIDDYCARCRCRIAEHASTGSSGIYNPGAREDIILCEPCFFDEDAQIEEEGTNDLPETLKLYLLNLSSRD